MKQKLKRNLFEVMNKVNLNIFILTVIKLSIKNNRSYNEKIKRWVINNRTLNLLLLKWIIDKIYPKTYRNWTLSNSDKDIKDIEVIYKEL